MCIYIYPIYIVYKIFRKNSKYYIKYICNIYIYNLYMSNTYIYKQSFPPLPKCSLLIVLNFFVDIWNIAWCLS